MAIKFRFWPLLLLCSFGAAQGMFSPPPAVNASSSTLGAPVLMGENVPETLTVTEAQGIRRPLLSYKSALEVLVVFFFSPACPPQQMSDFHLFYNKFKEWHVAFVAVSSQNNDAVTALLKNANLEAIPVVYDQSKNAVRLLNPPGTPWMMVLDETGHLRYRGPLHTPDTDQVMDDIIGHVQPVINPEPGGTPQCPLPHA